MPSLPQVTITGTLTADPELRFTPSGVAVANFSIACNTRKKQGNDWVDGPATFVRCTVWKEYAENVAESLTRGTRVIAQGSLQQRDFETREGEKRTVLELQVEEIGPSLRWATARVNKAAKGNSGGGRSQAQEEPSGDWGSGDSGDGWS